MPQIDIQALIDLFKESVGIESAEKTVYEAIRDANLPKKNSYDEEEFSKICDVFKKKGSPIVKIIATVVSTNKFKDFYYEKELARERKEKEELVRLAEALEQKVQERISELKIANEQLKQEVSERKRIEKTLRDAEERFRQVTISSGDWIWEVDVEGRYTYSSSAVKDILGYEPEEVLGKYYYDFFIPEERERLALKIKNIFVRKKKLLHLINKNLHKDGHMVIHETTGVPVIDAEGNLVGYRGVDRDITERLQAEEDLRKQREELQTIIDSSPAMIFYKDKENTFIRINKALAESTGLSKEEIEGKSCFDVYPLQAQHYWEDDKEVMMSAKPKLNIIEQLETKQGIRWLQTDKIPYRDSQGNIIGIIGFAIDITERLQAEEGLRDASNKLKQTQAQMIQTAKMAAVGQLSAGVAHEINNPLGGILGYAQFILAKLGKTEFTAEDFKTCRKYLEYIERESQRCKQIIENLLTFSRKSSEKFELVDIKSTIETTFSILKHSLELQNIKITIEYAPQLLQVFGNTNQLQQVFTNIIINAQQVMPKGGELIISGQVVEEDKKKKVAISFQDTGCGIPKESLNSVFEPFFTTKQEVKSLGLGLSICYQIIQQHNGEILVESEVGKGAKFTVILPCNDKPR